MKRRRTRELQVSRSREILAELLQIKARAKRIGSTQLAALQRQSVPSVIRIARILELSARAKHTIYAAVIEADLRVIFRIDGSWVTTLDVGSHRIYRT
jgi:hypothetical protein